MASDGGHNVVGGGLVGGGTVALAWLVTHLKGWHLRAIITSPETPEEKKDKDPPTVREYRDTQHDVERVLGEIKFSVSKLETILLNADIPLIKQTQSVQSAEIGVLKTDLIGIRGDIASLKRCDEDMEERLDSQARQIRDLKG